MTGGLVFFRDGIILPSDKWDKKRKSAPDGGLFLLVQPATFNFKIIFCEKR